MDLSSINKANNIQNKNVSFQGSKTVKNETGDRMFRVYPPYIKLDEGDELGVQLIELGKINDRKLGYNWYASSEPIDIETDEEFKKGKKTYFDIDLDKYWLKDCGEFGYRYVVRHKDGSCDGYTDSIGTTIKQDDMEFTVASTNQGTPRNMGPMEHIFTDSYNVVLKILAKLKSKSETDKSYDELIAEARRNHVNKFGGTIQGIIEKIETELASKRLIMSTPLIGGGGDSHMYHQANPFHISAGTGTKEDFLDLQKACFNHGSGYTLDGAFTSQGYEGLQLNHALRWQDSPFKYWFKNPSENGFELGVLPDTDNKYTGIRIVNPKGVEGYEYDPDMPSYVQFYDTRLVSDEQLEQMDKLIDKYDKTGTDDPFEIVTHQNSVLPKFFQIDPSKKPYYGNAGGTYEELKEKGQLQDILSPEKLPYTFTRKSKISGYTGWDGSSDLVKMNLSNHIQTEEMKEGNNQAKNYMYNVAKYWTTETRNALIMEIANEISSRQGNGSDQDKKEECKPYFEEIEKNFGLEPNSLDKIYAKVLREKDAKLFESQNIKKGYNNYKIADDKRDGTTYIREEILDFPLESLNFSPELLSVLSTPYITPRPSANGNPAGTKTEIFEDAKRNTHTKLSPTMQEVYTKTLPSLIKQTLEVIQREQNVNNTSKFNEKLLYNANGDNIGELTPYGKYFLEMSIDDMMTFFITEGLFDDTYPSFENGHLSYEEADKKAGNKGHGERLTLEKLNIHESSPEAEAEAVAKKLKKGLEQLQDTKSKDYQKFKDYLVEKYYSLSPEDYKMAEAVIDQTGAGLNWRFDAAKDVGDWDELAEAQEKDEGKAAEKTGRRTSGDVWDDVIDFWKPFVKTVRDINPSSYVIAEVTSLHDFDKFGWGKYGNADKAEKAFYEETGATTGSNYSTYFGLYPKLFGKNIEEGAVDNFRSITNFLERTYNFVKPGDDGLVMPEFILGSHIFLDNHDKPRAAHLMAVDAALFWSAFKTGDKFNEGYKNRAEKALGRDFEDNMSSKAVAVAEKYYDYFDKNGKSVGLSDSDIQILKDATKRLANGYQYNDINDETPDFDRAEAFGSTPYETTLPYVVAQAESMGLKLTNEQKKDIVDKVRHDMVKPYISKMTAIYEMMAGTVGIPTIFAGGEFAQTGCETKSKNSELGCRNITRHDWIEGPNTKEDVVRFNKRIERIDGLGAKPGSRPLSDGTPIVIMPKETNFVEAAGPNEYKAALHALNDGDLRATCNFINNVNSKTRDEILETVDKMSGDEVVSGVKNFLKTTNNPGLRDWVVQNIRNNTQVDETGAVYKYNDRGEGVITMMTNAYIPKNVDRIGPLLTSANDEVVKPKISEVTLKDKQGNLIAEPGTTFQKVTYNEHTQEYVDNGVYELQEDGTLKPFDKKATDALDSTVTYFYKTVEPREPDQVPVG